MFRLPLSEPKYIAESSNVKCTLFLIITINWVVLDYIFSNFYTYITIYQHNRIASPEKQSKTNVLNIQDLQWIRWKNIKN